MGNRLDILWVLHRLWLRGHLDVQRYQVVPPAPCPLEFLDSPGTLGIPVLLQNQPPLCKYTMLDTPCSHPAGKKELVLIAFLASLGQLKSASSAIEFVIRVQHKLALHAISWEFYFIASYEGCSISNDRPWKNMGHFPRRSSLFKPLQFA